MATTDCRAAIETFEAFLNAPGARRSDIAGALAHLRTCPACTERAGNLARLLAAGTVDEDVLTCAECEELLPGYLTSESLGEAGAPEWARVERHLEACPHCADALASLAGLVALGFADSGAEPPQIPEPNPSSLRSREPSAARVPPAPERTEPAAHDDLPPAESVEGQFQRGPRPAPWRQAAQGVYRLAAAIPVLIGRAGASFGSLAGPLTVQLAPVPVYRGMRPLAPAEEARDFRELLELPHPETNVTLKVSLGPLFEGRGSLALAAGTIDPSTPIAQARVTLRDADGALLEGASTGEDGVVLFRDLDAGEYLIRVEHAEKAWELPVSFASA